MAVANIVFNGTTITYYLPSSTDEVTPSIVRHTLNGAKQRHIAPYANDDYVTISGFMSSTNFATLRSARIAGTTGSLVGTFGTVSSAMVVETNRRETPGSKAGIDHFVYADIVFLKLAQWA